MASPKAIRRDARALYKLSLGADGRLDATRVTAILAALDATPPASYLNLLRAYQRLVQAEISRGEARIEHAGPIAPEAAAAIAAGFAKRYKRPVAPVTVPNNSLIAGLRVRVGDDLYDMSVAGALAAVAEASAA